MMKSAGQRESHSRCPFTVDLRPGPGHPSSSPGPRLHGGGPGLRRRRALSARTDSALCRIVPATLRDDITVAWRQSDIDTVSWPVGIQYS